MEQRSNHAASKDVQIKPRREECALGMGQRRNSNCAAIQDALIKLKKEECALSMGLSTNDAAVKDALIKLGKEEYVGGTGQTAIQTKNLLLLHRALDPNSKRLLLLILICVLQQVLRATVVCLEW